MEPPLVARHLLLLVLVSLASAAGCRRPQLATGVSDSAFVAVMADLKRVQDAPGMDSAQRAARRDSILQSRGLTPAQLEAAAKQLAQNPGRAQTVWQAVQQRAAEPVPPK
jgi:hypothetical protein